MGAIVVPGRPVQVRDQAPPVTDPDPYTLTPVLIVSGTGPRETVERAFRTHIGEFAGSKTFFGNTTPAYVPSKLAGTVVVRPRRQAPAVQFRL